MNSASEAFEQEIHRIYELLLNSGAEVTWNDHIPDPDNLRQQRQIDVTIRRDGELTLVECRKHKSPQDVQWIEELIGRRMSLGAAAVIAVSSSGFTRGALSKAKAHGIIPRDLQQLTGAEIRSWGRSVALTLYFYQYFDLEVSLLFKRESIRKLDAELARSELKSHPVWQSLFNAAAYKLQELNLVAEEQAGQTAKFAIRLQLDGFNLCGESVVEVDFRGNARLVSKNVDPRAVFRYGEAGKNSAEREATVEAFRLGQTSVIHDGTRISMLLDISQVEMPPFCQFRFFRVSGGEMDYEAIELDGVEKVWVRGGRMRINICSTC